MKRPFVKNCLLKATGAWSRWWRRQSKPALHQATGVVPDWSDQAVPNPFFEGLAG